MNRTGGASTFGLKALANEMIDDAKYYLGSRSSGSPNPIFGTAEEMYTWEHGNTLCGACGGVSSRLSWIGKIALMYASDAYMVYGKGVSDTCFNDPNACNYQNAIKGWIYNSNVRVNTTNSEYTWLLPVISNGGSDALRIYYTGGVSAYSGSMANNFVRPVVYLKSDVLIVGGIGSIDNPYILK